MAVHPLRHLRRSAGYLRALPVLSLALGGSIVLSTAAVCFGFGAIAAPWFHCELFASQLAAATGRRPSRRASWIGAGLFLLGAVLMVASAAWVGTQGLGSGVSVVERPGASEGADLRIAIMATAGGLLALVFILPFLYAPLILIDRGGRIGAAAMSSARLVLGEGFLSHLGLSLSSHGVQAAPVLLAGAISILAVGREAVPLAVLAALPLLSLTIPLGQGMIVAAWAERRGRVPAPAATPTGPRPGRALVAALILLFLAPVLSFVLVGASVARPSRPQPIAAPAGEMVIDRALSEIPLEVVVPDTALLLRAGVHGVSVVAFDGGGAGTLPRSSPAPIRRLQVVRVQSAYALVLVLDDGPRVSWIDRAGVRLDDGLTARLADRLPPWLPLLMAFVLLATPLAFGRVLASLSAGAPGATGEDGSGEGRVPRPALERQAWLRVALVLPASVASLVGALTTLL